MVKKYERIGVFSRLYSKSNNSMEISKHGKKITELTGHESRVLHMALSPDGKVVASAAGSGDETIRLWRIFDSKKELTNKVVKSKKGRIISGTLR